MEEADVVPVPKQRPVQDINKHLRPISLTPILSKIAEEYVVDTYVKPAVLSKIDPQQFGTLPESSTTHASISMTHSWAKSTDGNHEKTHRACTVSIPVSSIQFLIICYKELYGAFQETFLH